MDIPWKRIGKTMELKDFFAENSKAALAFSGGVDSAFLLWAAKQYGAQVKAYYIKTPFQPQFELDDAVCLAKRLDADMAIIETDVLQQENIAANSVNRCYYCKRHMLREIRKAADMDGFSLLIDGTNASDDAADRLGMQALREEQVRSPLRECGLTKTQIRSLSKEVGLFTHDKPAYACLATRIPTGTKITAEDLQRTERSEAYLRELGFSDFRIRLMGNSAKIQVQESQLSLLLKLRQQIVDRLGSDYAQVLLDMEVRHE